MPRFDRDQVRKGVYMTGAPCEGRFVARRARDDDEKLRRQYPEFENVIKEAGPSYGPEFEKHQASIQQLTQRLQQVRKELERYNKAKPK
jgi:hypothetical protein